MSERRSERIRQRLDYKTLHNTGEFVYREVSGNFSSSDSEDIECHPTTSPNPSTDSTTSKDYTLNPSCELNQLVLNLSEQLDSVSILSDSVSILSDSVSIESEDTECHSTNLANPVTDSTSSKDLTSNPSFELNHVVVNLPEQLDSTSFIMSDESKLSESKFTSIVEEVDDYIDENPVTSLLAIEDIDICCSRLEKSRSELRSLNRDLVKLLDTEDYERALVKQYEYTIDVIKTYILDAKKIKSNIRQNELNMQDHDRLMKDNKHNEDINQKTRATGFLYTEVTRLINDSLTVFNKVNNDDVTDEEIERRNEELVSNVSKVDQLSSKFQNLLQLVPDNYPQKEEIVKDMTDSYNKLVSRKGLYESELKFHVRKRELQKEKSFQASALNIKLQIFSGYASDLDIYTFQMEFEKLYLKATPKKMLPDLLKNNYLADPALSLVKSLEDINEIWGRLKKAYGDPKTMLSKKLASVRKIGPLWKIKDSERLIEGLVSITNAMTDLIKLSKRHKVEAKLYNGEAVDIIYSMMGDRRVTNWLGSIYGEELEDEELWKRLISFLERELELEQQRSLIMRRLENNKQTTGDSNKQRSYWSSEEYQADQESNMQCKSCSAAGHMVDGKQCNDRNEGDSMDKEKRCYFCDEAGHAEVNSPRGTLIQYFACRRFVEMTPAQRFQELKLKGLCFQCLYPGASQIDGKHGMGNCQRDFTCQHPTHDKYPRKKHILVCHEHRLTHENKALLDTYKQRFILPLINLPKFSKDIKLSFLSYQTSIQKQNTELDPNDDEIITDNGIYMLQTIKVDDKHFTLFFDTGCSDMVCRFEAIQKIGSRAQQERKGPIDIGGVGDIKIVSDHGIYQVRLPLHDNKNAVFSGICLKQITTTFPIYPLHGKVEDDIREAHVQSGGIPNTLPVLPKFIGGDVDFMIGAKYFRYHPEAIFTLPSGLTIYRSPFINADGGGRGVLGGPHEVFTNIDKLNNENCQYANAYLSEQFKIYKMGYQVNPDNKLLTIKVDKDFNFDILNETDDEVLRRGKGEIINQNKTFTVDSKCLVAARKHKYFEAVENAASEILYRCVDCRKCVKCKNGERIEMLSIKEEVEQDLIQQSVYVDTSSGTTIAKLPLMEDPALKLAPNKEKALAIYNSQLKKLNKSDKDKKDVLESEAKLQNMGHVEYVKNLSEEQQLKLRKKTIQNYIPWTCVWNLNSLSTPCRLVFNASLPTKSRLSLNDILAKGMNSMNKLVEIMIRWMTHKFALHCDVQKMYNTVKLVEEHWCLQRYIWEENLDPGKIPEEKIIKTLIYGVKSSGNQAEHGLRETANLFKEEYPEVSRIVRNDIYVDDCLSGENSRELVYKRADELSLVLQRGGFNLKGFTFSGDAPLKRLSGGEEYVKVAGVKWFPMSDEVQLDIRELNFSKKKRGRKELTSNSKVPDVLTKRDCVSKVSEIFDLTGKVTPVVASMKLDLHTLVQRKLDWDDQIPEDLRNIWISNFQMMEELNNIRFNRAVVPPDAVSLDMNTIDAADASKDLACAATYVRFLRKNGDFSCQLVFSRSKILPANISQPRAELYAANLNAHTGEVVRRSFGKFHKGAVKLTDSQIVMHWISNEDLSLKQWVRNRVVEILRFSKPSSWKYVQGSDMIADLGTRAGATIRDISPGSVWIEGYPWMTKEISSFPVKTCSEIKLSKLEIVDINEESIIPNNNKNPENHSWPPKSTNYTVWDSKSLNVPAEVKSRYEFSNYIYDPNKYGYRRAIRVIAIIKRFIHQCRMSVRDKSVKGSERPKEFVLVTDEEFQEASKYYFRKATLEVKEFCKKKEYERISYEKDDILFHKGRILPNQCVSILSPITDVMRDLAMFSFSVPLIEKNSPLAFSIINEVHWNDKVAKHAGVETVLRYSMKYGYILEGRELVKMFGRNCERCRYIAKRTIDVSMGPLSKYNLTIAPAFFITQVDLAGPFRSYSPHNKRTTLKVWLLVFCCATTSTINIKVMEDCGTSAFLQGFIRFSCEAGYPKILLTDEGGQLMKGSKIMRLNYRDLQRRLHLGMNVELETCPVGGHNMHGRVERKIRHIRESIEKSVQNERLSILQWETLSAEIANAINDLPLGLGSIVSDLENLDLITPNRLKLGRNNDRSPVGPMLVTNDTDKFLKLSAKIFVTWFEAWLVSYVPRLIEQPKWFSDSFDISEGDVVLFLKHEGRIAGDYQYGMIVKVHRSNDARIRSVDVKYRNPNENVDRVTHRAVRGLVMIHPVNETNLLTELHEIATFSDMKKKIEVDSCH